MAEMTIFQKTDKGRGEHGEPILLEYVGRAKDEM